MTRNLPEIVASSFPQRDWRAQAEVLRAGIMDFLDGDYEGPRQHRRYGCRHGVFLPHACEECIEDHFRDLLAILDHPEPPETPETPETPENPPK